LLHQHFYVRIVISTCSHHIFQSLPSLFSTHPRSIADSPPTGRTANFSLPLQESALTLARPSSPQLGRSRWSPTPRQAHRRSKGPRRRFLAFWPSKRKLHPRSGASPFVSSTRPTNPATPNFSHTFRL
jgi:hypothetical protein